MKKRLFKYIFCFLVFSIFVCLYSNYLIEGSSEDFLYDDVAEIPPRKVGLVLGASLRLPDGRINLFMYNRLKAAKQLFDKGKIEYLLVSGDNQTKEYNEPEDIKNKLITMGIPQDRIVLDYAGFRTLDSVIRAKEVFGQDEFTIISQSFQNERAIFIALKNGIQAVGFNAEDVSRLVGLKVYIREYLARVAAVLDVYVFDRGPKFYGEKIEIDGQHTLKSRYQTRVSRQML